MTDAIVRTPGEYVGSSSDYKTGKGVYSLDGRLYASVVGSQQLVESVAGADDLRPTIEVRREKEGDVVPEAGVVVTGRITKVQSRMALADIVCIGSRVVKEKFSGIVRQQDVRLTEIDKVDMHACFRPGDIIRAEVLSLGDSRAYYLSTAKNEYGVICATSVGGGVMVPVSWEEMECPLSNQKEFRKVAKSVEKF